MTRIPQLERQLVEAAARRAPRRRLMRRLRLPPRRPSAVVAFAAGLLLVAGSAAAVLVTRGEVGGEPSLRYGPDAPEADLGIHYDTRPVVLATGRIPGGERFELVGYQQSSRGQSELCIDVTFPDSGIGHGCANDYERAQGISSGRGHPTQVEGATSPETSKVVVHYRAQGIPGKRTAALVHVTDPAVIKRIRVDGPFGFYLVELPEGAEHMRAVGLDHAGRPLWRAVFLQPDYSRPRPPDFQGRSNLRG